MNRTKKRPVVVQKQLEPSLKTDGRTKTDWRAPGIVWMPFKTLQSLWGAIEMSQTLNQRIALKSVRPMVRVLDIEPDRTGVIPEADFLDVAAVYWATGWLLAWVIAIAVAYPVGVGIGMLMGGSL